MKQKNIKVFHIEDYKIIREGIKFLLSQDVDIEVVGGSKDPEELFEVLAKEDIDILLLDIYLDGMEGKKNLNGIEIIEIVKRDFPNTKIIAHSMYDSADIIVQVMTSGGKGFVSKKTGYEELIHAIKTVYTGKVFISADVAQKFKNLNEYIDGNSDILKPKNDIFSKREKEVLTLIAKGFSSKEIAKTLFITEKTIESHRKNMVQKACVKNTVELVSYALSRGIIKA